MYSGFQYSWLHLIFNSLILFYFIALAGKASFNLYVGGDLWKPYIGNLEIGLWMFSFTNNVEPELVEQKERRHDIRVSNIVRYLQDKLSRFPKQDNSSELE